VIIPCVMNLFGSDVVLKKFFSLFCRHYSVLFGGDEIGWYFHRLNPIQTNYDIFIPIDIFQGESRLSLQLIRHIAGESTEYEVGNSSSFGCHLNYNLHFYLWITSSRQTKGLSSINPLTRGLLNFCIYNKATTDPIDLPHRMMPLTMDCM